MGVYLLDSIARGGTAAQNEVIIKSPQARRSSSLSQEELELSSPDEKSAHIFDSSNSKTRRRSRAASI
jgi:hypothetical protein